MSESWVVRQCSPTLAGIKTGNLFPCNDGLRDEEVRALNRKLVPMGLRVIPIRSHWKSLVYLYRPYRLEKDLRSQVAKRILRGRGYALGCEGEMVVQLVRHFMGDKTFPHEVGLFLGYPAEDVEAFIEHHGKACCTGCWKAYGNKELAQRKFDMFKKCTRTYCRLFEKGLPVEKLAVKEREA